MAHRGSKRGFPYLNLELIETTAQAVDAGSSVIAQIRTLGQLSDNPERAQETLAACVLIEKVMLRRVTSFVRYKKKRLQTFKTLANIPLKMIIR